MTRFIIVEDDDEFRRILDKETNETIGFNSQVVGLLNTLHQENQQLKHYKLYEDNKRLQTIIAELKEENEQLKKLIERKDILLKNRTEYIEDRIQSFNYFISYMDTFLYKSDVDPNDVKQDIMNILQKWEIKKRECCR